MLPSQQVNNSVKDRGNQAEEHAAEADRRLCFQKAEADHGQQRRQKVHIQVDADYHAFIAVQGAEEAEHREESDADGSRTHELQHDQLDRRYLPGPEASNLCCQQEQRSKRCQQVGVHREKLKAPGIHHRHVPVAADGKETGHPIDGEQEDQRIDTNSRDHLCFIWITVYFWHFHSLLIVHVPIISLMRNTVNRVMALCADIAGSVLDDCTIQW